MARPMMTPLVGWISLEDTLISGCRKGGGWKAEARRVWGMSVWVRSGGRTFGFPEHEGDGLSGASIDLDFRGPSAWSTAILMARRPQYTRAALTGRGGSAGLPGFADGPSDDDLAWVEIEVGSGHALLLSLGRVRSSNWRRTWVMGRRK